MRSRSETAEIPSVWTLDENPNCEETYVSLRLAGDDLVPEEVERVTGLRSEFGAAKGELRRSRTGRETRQRTGVWGISSRDHVTSTSVERHILYLLEKVEPVRDNFLTVAGAQGATADFMCYWVRLADQGGP